MKVDAGIAEQPSGDLSLVPERIRSLEADGYDGALSTETAHNPFLPILLAAEHSERIELMTSIAVAFARSPMTVASMAHDLNAYSQGRFVLGLGSQIKPHITKRFSMPWSSPAARMKEFISALRAIWGCWYDREPLSFRGEHYTHTLMTPMFTPENTEHGAPRVLLAAVGPLMTEVAGEVADGIIVHSFTTKKYFDEVTMPAVERGLAASGRSRDDFEVCYPGFVVSGATEESCAESRRVACKRIAFYGSTPAYRPVLEAHGWGELQTELNILSKQGEWDAMGERITDEILDAFAVIGEGADVAAQLEARWGGAVDRLATPLTFVDGEARRALIRELQAI